MDKVFQRFVLYVHPKVPASIELQDFVVGNEIPMRIVNKKKDYPPDVRGIPALKDTKTGDVKTGSDAMERVNWLVNMAYDIQDVLYEYFQQQMSEMEHQQQGAQGGSGQGGYGGGGGEQPSRPAMDVTVDRVQSGVMGAGGEGAQLGNTGRNLGAPSSAYADTGGKITEADIQRMMQARKASLPQPPGR